MDKTSRIISMVKEFLINAKDITDEKINKYINHVLQGLNIEDNISINDSERNRIIDEINYIYQVETIPGQYIAQYEEDEEWYSSIKDKIEPIHWSAYKILLETKNLSPSILEHLDKETLDENIVRYLGNPNSNKSFLRRGLVIGDVQSGKTSTYRIKISKK